MKGDLAVSFAQDVAELREPGRHSSSSPPADIATLNPNTRTVRPFALGATRIRAHLRCTGAWRYLWRECDGGTLGLRFMRMPLAHGEGLRLVSQREPNLEVDWMDSSGNAVHQGPGSGICRSLRRSWFHHFDHRYGDLCGRSERVGITAPPYVEIASQACIDSLVTAILGPVKASERLAEETLGTRLVVLGLARHLPQQPTTHCHRLR